MSRPSSELAHLFRALKAPAAARALPKLADRARADEWSYEQFAAALLKTEADSRDSHGGQGRIKAARFPARKTNHAMREAERELAQQAEASYTRMVRDWQAARPAKVGASVTPGRASQRPSKGKAARQTTSP
jgi:DNA replication protein DnaC